LFCLELYHLEQWFSTFSLKGAEFSLITLSESHTKEILTQVNWHVVFHSRTRSVTQNTRNYWKTAEGRTKSAWKPYADLTKVVENHWFTI